MPPTGVGKQTLPRSPQRRPRAHAAQPLAAPSPGGCRRFPIILASCSAVYKQSGRGREGLGGTQNPAAWIWGRVCWYLSKEARLPKGI